MLVDTRASLLLPVESRSVSEMGASKNFYAHMTPYFLWKIQARKLKQEFYTVIIRCLLFQLFTSSFEWPLNFYKKLLYILANAEREKEI